MLIRTNNLKKTYQTDAGELPVIKGIDITIDQGDMIAIVGASGVGKSTFLHILGTLDKPTSGDVFFNDVDVFKLNDKALAAFRNQSIGFVFQFHHLLSEFNVLENIIMPGLIQGMRKDLLIKKAIALANDLGLSERLHHRPGELSGGEQQRVAVSRALILDPQLVLADEPTGNLDTRTGENLFKLLLDLNKEKGISFIIVTHNGVLANRCQRIYQMIDGKFLL